MKPSATITVEKPLFAPYPRVVPCLALIAAVFAAYANCFDNAFLFDDNLIITLNEDLRSWNTLDKLLTGSTISGVHVAGGFYRPMQMLLYFIIYQALGSITIGFHLLNVALHAANVCLIFTLGRRLGFNVGATFLATLLWALHPIHTEAVTYMSATADPLFSLFCLLGVINLFPDFSPRRFYISCLYILAALASKEVAVVFPFLATITLYTMHPERNKWRTYIRTWPLWVIMAAYTVWRMSAPWLDGPQTYDDLYKSHDYYNLALYAKNLSYRVYTFFATLPSYAGLLLWPADLRMERSFPVFVSITSPLVIGGVVMTLASAGQVFYSHFRARFRPLAWGLLWFAGAHLPDSGLLIPANSFFLEHWMYLPSAGLFLGVAQTINNLLPASAKYPHLAQRAATSATLLLSLALGVATHMQNQIWENPITFYTHVFKYGEVSARAHNNLALAYADAHQPEKAIAEFHKAIETSDTYAETRHNLAIFLLSLPEQQAYMDEAIANLERAVEIDPNFFRSWGLLARIYKFKGDHERAERYKEKAESLMKSFMPELQQK